MMNTREEIETKSVLLNAPKSFQVVNASMEIKTATMGTT